MNFLRYSTALVLVTQFCRSDTILRGFDIEATSLVATQMKSNGIDSTIWCECTKNRERKNDFKLLIVLGGINILTRFCLPQAVPQFKGLQIGSTGLKFGINNEVLVDKYSSHQSVLFMRLVTSRTENNLLCCKKRLWLLLKQFFIKIRLI